MLGDEDYIPSDIFRLRDSEYYEIFSPLAHCNITGDVFAHIEPAPEKCAMSLVTTHLSATTSHATPGPVTSTTPTTTPLPQRPTMCSYWPWVLGMTCTVMTMIVLGVVLLVLCVMHKKRVAVNEQTPRREFLDLCVHCVHVIYASTCAPCIHVEHYWCILRCTTMKQHISNQSHNTSSRTKLRPLRKSCNVHAHLDK